MTTRSVVLAVDTTAIPEVGRLLADQGIQLGPVTAQQGKLRFFTADYPELPGLTTRDVTLLNLIAQGLTMYAIGRQMRTSYDGARDMAKRLYRKLGATNRTHAVAVAHRIGALNQEAA